MSDTLDRIKSAILWPFEMALGIIFVIGYIIIKGLFVVIDRTGQAMDTFRKSLRKGYETARRKHK